MYALQVPDLLFIAVYFVSSIVFRALYSVFLLTAFIHVAVLEIACTFDICY